MQKVVETPAFLCNLGANINNFLKEHLQGYNNVPTLSWTLVIIVNVPISFSKNKLPQDARKLPNFVHKYIHIPSMITSVYMYVFSGWEAIEVSLLLNSSF